MAKYRRIVWILYWVAQTTWLQNAGSVDNPSAPADITVGTAIVAASPERFGANLQVDDYLPYNLNGTTFNNWTGDSGMEPVILRYNGTATVGSDTAIENNEGPTTSAGDTIADGFFDGAEVRV